MRVRPPAQSKSQRPQNVAENVGGEESVNLIIVGERQSEQVGPLSRGLLSGDEWGNGLIVECAVA